MKIPCFEKIKHREVQTLQDEFDQQVPDNTDMSEQEQKEIGKKIVLDYYKTLNNEINELKVKLNKEPSELPDKSEAGATMAAVYDNLISEIKNEANEQRKFKKQTSADQVQIIKTIEAEGQAAEIADNAEAAGTVIRKIDDVLESASEDEMSAAINSIEQNDVPILEGVENDKFNNLPEKVRQSIEQNISVISETPELKPHIQNVVEILHDKVESGESNFNVWAKQGDLFKETIPAENYSKEDLALAKKLDEGKSVNENSDIIKNVAQKMTATESTLTESEKPGLTFNEALAENNITFQFQEPSSEEVEDMKEVIKEMVDADVLTLKEIQDKVASELEDDSDELRDLVTTAYHKYGKDKENTPKEVTGGVIGRIGKWLAKMFGGTQADKIFIAKDTESLERKAAELTGVRYSVDYRMDHTAPNENDTPLYNLTNAYGDDIYSDKAYYYFGDGDRIKDKKSAAILQSLKGKPDAEVTVYRAVPKGVKEINSGDWVSINKDYAKEHGERILDGNYDIIEKKLKASQIFTDGNSMHEQGVVFMKSPTGEILGFSHNGKIYLNAEHLNPNTPIHEAGHLMLEFLKQNDTKVYNRGIELVTGSHYYDSVKQNKFYKDEANKLPADQREEYFKQEALAAAIGDRGAQFVTEAKKKGFAEWLNNLWEAVKNTLGLKNITAKELSELTLDEFSKRAAADILRQQTEAKEALNEITDQLKNWGLSFKDAEIIQGVADTDEKILQGELSREQYLRMKINLLESQQSMQDIVRKARDLFGDNYIQKLMDIADSEKDISLPTKRNLATRLKEEVAQGNRFIFDKVAMWAKKFATEASAAMNLGKPIDSVKELDNVSEPANEIMNQIGAEIKEGENIVLDAVSEKTSDEILAYQQREEDLVKEIADLKQKLEDIENKKAEEKPNKKSKLSSSDYAERAKAADNRLGTDKKTIIEKIKEIIKKC